MKRGLGKGLDALLRNTTIVSSVEEKSEFELNDSDSSGIVSSSTSVAISKIITDPNQPRKHFDEEKLNLLAESIKSQGVLQPILIRKSEDKFIIIAGERRFLASKLAGLTEVPVLIVSPTEQDIRVISLIENIQREDLNPIELCNSFTYLVEEMKFTHEQIGEALGIARATVSNTIRLGKLSKEVKEMVTNGDIDLGIAKLLISLAPEQQILVAQKVKKDGLTVKQTEIFINSLKEDKPVKEPVILEKKDYKHLSQKLSAKIIVNKNKVSFAFNDETKLSAFLQYLESMDN